MSNLRISIALLCFVVGEIYGITTKGCGSTKGCFSDPASCSGSDCKLLVTWKYDPTTKIADFEVVGSGSAWVAVGLNAQKQMSGTKGLICHGTGGNIKIKEFSLSKQGLSAGDYHPLPVGITLKSRGIVNGKLTCSYSRNTTVAFTNQSPLDQAWYLVTAWGNKFNSTLGLPGYHGNKGKMIKTDKQINITSNAFQPYKMPSSSPYHSVSVGVIFISIFAILAQMWI